MAAEPQTLFLPNIGAEESHRSGKTLAQHPVVIHLGELWQKSFGLLTESTGDNSSSHQNADWDDLPTAPGLLPWFATQATFLEAQERGLPHLGPQPQIVQTIHNKGFAKQLAQTIGHNTGWQYSHILQCLQSEQEAKSKLEEILAGWPQWAQANFTIKPCMGSSGRGRIAGKNGLISTQHIRGLMKMSQRGGAIVEPWYSTINNLSTQIFFKPDHTWNICGHTSQVLTQSGTYLGNHGRLVQGKSDSGTQYDSQLEQVAQSIAPLIQEQGFEGMCGFDAFSFLCPETGEEKFRAPLEINARFTSATVGLRYMRHLASQHSIDYGSWLFLLDAREAWCKVAVQNPDWKSWIIPTKTTGKKALILISEHSEILKQWLVENKLRP
jgi:hypothetical protein